MLARHIVFPVVTMALSGCWLSDAENGHVDGGGVADADADGDADLGVVDLLFEIDNSGSMSQEQTNLTEAFSWAVADLPPVVESLHIGVITTDMGTGGFAVQTCRDPVDGDDGILWHRGGGAVMECLSEYPQYLSWSVDEPFQDMAEDFRCIATLGTGGCGFQQHFKAIRRALVYHGDGANAGFLRPGSLVALLIVSGEDDCSIRTDTADANDIFDTQLDLGPLNLRCYNYEDEYLEAVDAFVGALLSLRSPRDLVVGGIVGLPPDDRHDCNLTSPAEGDLDCILELPEMQLVIDTSAAGRGERLTPSCHDPELGESYPPRRIVQFVRGVIEAGGAGFVRSICEQDLTHAVSQMIETIAYRIGR